MTTVEQRASPALLAPLRRPSFRWLASGRTAMYFANSMAPIALSFAVLDLTGSVVDLGIVVGARSMANVMLLLFGGVIADRLPRALILQGSSFVAAAIQAVLAACLFSGAASIPLLVVLSVGNGVVAAISLPAAAALTPQTVPAGEIRRANAVVSMGRSIGIMAGAAAGGLLVSVGGSTLAMASNAVVFLFASLSFFGVRVAVGHSGDRSRPLAQLREGWSEFTSRTWVWAVVVQLMVVNAALTGGFQVLGPTVADATIGRTAWGVVLATQPVGALLGGVIAARWQPRRALRFGVGVVALTALPLIALAATHALIPMMLTMFVSGFVMEQFTVAWDVALQENIRRDRLARVYSYDSFGSFVAIPLGQVTIGPAALWLGADATLLIAAAALVAATAAALGVRSVRSLTSTDAAPDSG